MVKSISWWAAPCQGFSVGGRRSATDVRNGLIYAFCEAVRSLRPRYFIMENVPGIQSVRDPETSSLVLDVASRRLRRAGFRVFQPLLLDAAWFGVAQRRRRTLLVGARSDQENTPTTLARLQDLASAEDLPITVGEVIADLPNADEFLALLSDDAVTIRLSERKLMPRGPARLLTGARDKTDFSYPRAYDRTKLTASRRTVHTARSIARFAATSPGSMEPVSRFYRLHLELPSTTLRAGTGYERGSFTSPRPIHPVHNRVITVREAARLQSFPDWLRFHTTKWHGFRQVGNSVPPRLARAVAQEIVYALNLQPVPPTTKIELGDPSLLRLNMTDAAQFWSVPLSAVPWHGLRYREAPPR